MWLLPVTPPWPYLVGMSVSFLASSSSSTMIQVFTSEERTWRHVHTLGLQYLCFQSDFQAAFLAFPMRHLGERRSSANLSRTVNPWNRELLWDVPVASEQDVNDAVAAAKQAFPSWSKTAWCERGRLLSKAREALFVRKDEMTNFIMQEGGKPVRRPSPWNGVGATGREFELTRTSDKIRSFGGGTCHGLFGLSL